MERPSVQILVVVANIQVNTDLEGRCWRKVPCQWQSGMGESTLSVRGNPPFINRENRREGWSGFGVLGPGVILALIRLGAREGTIHTKIDYRKGIRLISRN